ncbi:MAG: glycoside hydrolase family 57 protein, partial [Candidatus Omnitrophota bacterium]
YERRDTRMSTKHRLNVAFVWHMHQPYYKDDARNVYAMPWVRLHGVKDYYPMASLLERFDTARAVFNFVPVLVEQINDYARNNARDTLLELSIKRPQDMDLADRREALCGFFKVRYKQVIEPNKRYFDLLVKRGVNITAAQLQRSAERFSECELLDLQVLFNLSWFHSISFDEDKNLQSIRAKEQQYTESDKQYVLQKQHEILTKIIPLYRRLQEAGRIEISCSPYYHPILPLLCDTNIARVPSPKLPLPARRFSHPEDAKRQIIDAIAYHTTNFGSPPRGMWPSEGSVSDKALELIAEAGIRWIAADEDILFATLKKMKARKAADRTMLYRPYRIEKKSGSVAAIFRDKNLSDLISFNYHSWAPEAAAEDLFGHFSAIHENFSAGKHERLATIVMDGENAWEYYHDNGRQFFETLYGRFDTSDTIKTTTVRDYLRREPPKRTLDLIVPGSWINRNFEVWIGNTQKNLAWEYVGIARDELMKASKRGIPAEKIRKAWRELFITEGSDWNWWHTFDSGTSGRDSFESLFRMHLKTIYALIGSRIPKYLKKVLHKL